MCNKYLLNELIKRHDSRLLRNFYHRNPKYSDKMQTLQSNNLSVFVEISLDLFVPKKKMIQNN